MRENNKKDNFELSEVLRISNLCNSLNSFSEKVDKFPPFYPFVGYADITRERLRVCRELGVLPKAPRFVKKAEQETDTYFVVSDLVSFDELSPEAKLKKALDWDEGKLNDSIRVPANKVMTNQEIIDFLNKEDRSLELHYTVYQTKSRERMLASKVYRSDGAAFRDEEIFEISLDSGNTCFQASLLLNVFEAEGRLSIDVNSKLAEDFRSAGYNVPEDVEQFKNNLSSMVSWLNKEKLRDYWSLWGVYSSCVMRSLMDNKNAMDDLLSISGMSKLRSLGKGRKKFSFVSIEDYDVVLNVPFSHYEKVKGFSNL